MRRYAALHQSVDPLAVHRWYHHGDSRIGEIFLQLIGEGAPNSMGVSPAACTSFSKGIEIMPSARTGRVAVRSGSFQTLTCSVSSGPIR